MPQSYRCVHCLTPCGSLYRKYGSNTIKLSQCVRCNGDVDPYCEREWLLVTLDCVLLRDEAYRHVLFHRFVDLNVDGRRAILLLLVASMLRALLVREAVLLDGGGNKNSLALVQQASFLQVTLVSCIATLSMILVLYTALRTMSRRDELDGQGTKSSSSSGHAAGTSRGGSSTKHPLLSSVALPVYLSILLPTIACQALTLILHTWESSSTIQQLGSLLLVLYQWKGLTNLLQAEIVVTESERWNNTMSLLYSTLLLAMGLLGRAVVLATWDAMSSEHHPCPGLEWNVPNVLLLLLLHYVWPTPSSVCFA